MKVTLIVNGREIGSYGSVLHALAEYRNITASGVRVLNARVLVNGKLDRVII